MIEHVRESLDRLYNFGAVELVVDGPEYLHVNEDGQRITTSLTRQDAKLLMRAFASRSMKMQLFADGIVAQDAELVKCARMGDDSNALRIWNDMREKLGTLLVILNT